MKTRECVTGSGDSPMYRLGRHWGTIQAYLLPASGTGESPILA